MMKKISMKHDQRGLTLAEVMICVVLVALVVGPITMNFMLAEGNRASAVRITEATNNAQTLMEQISQRITDDIILKQKVDDKRLALVSGSTNEKRYNCFCNVYVNQHKELTAAQYSANLRGYLEQGLKNIDGSVAENTLARFLDVTEGDFGTLYNTKNYAYEVAIWPLYWSPIDTSHPILKMNATTLGLADPYPYRTVGLWTNKDYKLDGSEYTGSSNPISFTINNSYLKAFRDEQKKYIYATGTGADPYMVMNTIRLAAQTTPNVNIVDKSDTLGSSYHSTYTCVDETVEKNTIGSGASEVTKSYKFTIKRNGRTKADIDSDLGNTGATPKPYIGIVELDMTEFQDDTTYDNLAIEIVNQTGYDMIVKVISGKNGIGNSKVRDKYHIIVTDEAGADGGTGETTVSYSDETTPEENYIVAMVVREINTVTGAKGNILKKEIQLYSYDPTTGERR